VAPKGSARIGLPLALGLVAALMYLSLVQSVPHAALLGFMAPLPLMIAALGLGLVSTVAACAVGAVAAGAVAGAAFGASFLGIAGIPAILIAYRALTRTVGPDEKVRWSPAGNVLAWLTVASMVLLLVWVGALPPHDGGVRGWLEAFLSQALDMLGDQVDPKERREITRMLSAVLPAMIAGVWMLMAMVNAMAAQAILTRLGQGLRPDPDYLGLVLPRWLAALPLAAALTWMVLTGLATQETVAYIAANMAAIGLAPFAALGVATVHGRLAVGRQNAMLGLLAFYGTLMVFSIWALAPLSLVGLVRFTRVWIDRRRADTTEG